MEFHFFVIPDIGTAWFDFLNSDFEPYFGIPQTPKIRTAVWFIDILFRWYSESSVAVRWNGVLLADFLVPSSVRLGSS